MRIDLKVSISFDEAFFALALGYEDLNDHDELRHDPLFHVLAGKLEAKRSDCAPVAGKSTLNRLEHRPRREAGKYHKIDYDAPSLEALFVDIFLDGHKRAPKEIVLDLDATDDTIHGEQEGRFFHGYYDSYCYLPLYIFRGRFLLGAKLRPANIDGAAGAVDEVARIVARIRARWPNGVRPPAQAWLRANIRLMFQASVTRFHSPLTLSRPRIENWRKPITDFMMPNTGSGVCLRSA